MNDRNFKNSYILFLFSWIFVTIVYDGSARCASWGTAGEYYHWSNIICLFGLLHALWGGCTRLQTNTVARCCFTNQFQQLESIDADSIGKWFSAMPLESPLDLRALSTQACMRCLTTTELRGVTEMSTFNNVRPAITYLYTSTESSRPHDFDYQLKRFLRLFITLWHESHKAIMSGFVRVKNHLRSQCIELWRRQCSSLPKKQDAFGHSCLLICWNLMSQAKSTESIRYAHLTWQEDSMITYENNQDGSRPRDPKQVYANPTVPQICPVLGLGICFAVFGFLWMENCFMVETNTVVSTKSYRMWWVEIPWKVFWFLWPNSSWL